MNKKDERVVSLHERIDQYDQAAKELVKIRKSFQKDFPDLHSGFIGGEKGIQVLASLDLRKKDWQVVQENGAGRERKRNLKFIRCDICFSVILSDLAASTPASSSGLKLNIHHDLLAHQGYTVLHCDIAKMNELGVYVFDSSNFLDHEIEFTSYPYKEFACCQSNDFVPTLKKFCEKSIAKLNKLLAEAKKLNKTN